MNLPVLTAIARKDLVDAIRNRYLLVALLTPLSVALLIRFLMPGMTSMRELTIVLHDPGKSNFVTRLQKMPRINLVETGSVTSVEGEVENRDATGGLIVPANFDADVAAGKQPELTIYVNNEKNVIEQARFRNLLEQQVASLVEHPVPAQIKWIEVAKEPESRISLNQMFLPLIVLLAFTMTGSLVVPLLLVEEKEKRTMDFLLTSPAGLTEIITGKALTGAVYSVLISSALLAINYELVGNWPLTLLTTLLGLLLIVAIGLLMGSLFQTTMQVNTWASGVIFVLLAPAFPFPGSPALFETAMHLVPTYYFVEALKLSLAGSTPPRIWVQLAVVLACTFIAFFAGAWALRREQR